MRKYLKLILAAELLLVVLYAVYRRNHSLSGFAEPNVEAVETVDTKPARFVHEGYTVAAGSLKVDRSVPLTFRIVVDSLRIRNVSLTGSVSAANGKQSDVQVLVVDNNNYTKWKSNEDHAPLYTSGTAPTATIDLKIEESGLYFLVLNTGSPGEQTVQANVRLEYDKKVE